MTEPDRQRRSPEDEGEEPPLASPPEGATCAEHSERAALAVCPRCGAYACLACWHHTIRRCHACLMRDPAAAAPPIPWEDPRAALPMRYLATIASALRPTATAPAFAREELAAARRFWALSFLPLAVLCEIVPATHTLLFGPSFAVSVVGAPNAASIAIDLARAIGMGLLIASVSLVSIAVPFISLARAYAEKGYEHAPLRAVLYRTFLIPLSMVVAEILVWSYTTPISDFQRQMLGIVPLIPILLLFWSMRATARMASGAGPIASYLVAAVPLAVMLLAHEFLIEALGSWFPDPPAAPTSPAP